MGDENSEARDRTDSAWCVRILVLPQDAVNRTRPARKVFRLPLTPPAIAIKIDNFHTHMWPSRGHGNSRRRGNLESIWIPTPRTITMKTGQFHLRAWTTPPSFSSQRESRALMMRQDGYPNQGAPGGQADLPPGTFLLTRNKLDGERALDSRCDEKDGGRGRKHSGSSSRKARRG